MRELHDRYNATGSIITSSLAELRQDHLRAVYADVRESTRVLVDTGNLAGDCIVGKLLLGVIGRELGL